MKRLRLPASYVLASFLLVSVLSILSGLSMITLAGSPDYGLMYMDGPETSEAMIAADPVAMKSYDDNVLNPDFPDDDEILSVVEGRASIEIAFVPGTAFIAWVVTRDGMTGKLTNHGLFGVGRTLALPLPVGSTIKVGIKGYGERHCRFFSVVKPGFGRLAFWGTNLHSKFAMGGEALRYDRFDHPQDPEGCKNP